MTGLIQSIRERDPARPTFFEVILGYNGFHAILLHRFNGFFWAIGLKAIARFFANIMRILTGIEIHPEAKIGKRLFIDHGAGVVIGQTAIIGDDVTIYHGVTLGGKGNPDHTAKRHPTIKNGAVIGAGAQILGDITVGEKARVGANAVVLSAVPDKCVAVGNPARLVDCSKADKGKAYGLPREVIDPIMTTIAALRNEVQVLREQVENGKDE